MVKDPAMVKNIFFSLKCIGWFKALFYLTAFFAAFHYIATALGLDITVRWLPLISVTVEPAFYTWCVQCWVMLLSSVATMA